MAGEWRETTLSEVVELKRGYDLPARDRDVGPYPIVSSSGISGYHSQSMAKAPGVVTGRYGTIGEVFFITQDYWPLNTALYVRDFKGNHPRFISYFLKTLNFMAYSDKGAVPGINRNHLHSALVRIPSDIGEQQAIACILGALDDKIELNRRTSRTLEAMARAIFKSWFVDFDPVRAKAAVRREHPKWTAAQVSRAACPNLKPDIAAMFPDSFEDSELGEIPKGWRVGTVEDVAMANAWTLGRNDGLDVIDYIEISEVMRGEINTVARYERGSEPSRARRRLKHGDTAISMVRPDRGAYFLALHPKESLIASTGFAVMTPRHGNWAFLHALLTQPEFGKELGHLADGGAYPAIRPEVILTRPSVMPEAPGIISAFDTLAQPLYSRAEQCRSESRTLAAIRDVLLPRLISGELVLRNTEHVLTRCR